jgi:hypothetical protein
MYPQEPYRVDHSGRFPAPHSFFSIFLRGSGFALHPKSGSFDVAVSA